MKYLIILLIILFLISPCHSAIELSGTSAANGSAACNVNIGETVSDTLATTEMYKFKITAITTNSTYTNTGISYTTFQGDGSGYYWSNFLYVDSSMELKLHYRYADLVPSYVVHSGTLSTGITLSLDTIYELSLVTSVDVGTGITIDINVGGSNYNTLISDVNLDELYANNTIIFSSLDFAFPAYTSTSQGDMTFYWYCYAFKALNSNEISTIISSHGGTNLVVGEGNDRICFISLNEGAEQGNTYTSTLFTSKYMAPDYRWYKTSGSNFRHIPNTTLHSMTIINNYALFKNKSRK